MQPSTLPGRSYVSVGSERKSRLLFHWRARDFSIAPLTGQTPTFVRATAGGSVIDRNGRLRAPVHSQPRYEMVDLDGDGIRETPGLLIERQRTQICPNPQTPASWTSINGPVLTTGLVDPWGSSAAILIEDDDGAASEGKQSSSVPFTGDATKAAVVAIRAGTATAVRVDITDNTAVVTRHSVTVTWNGGTQAPTVTTGTGAGSIFPAVGVYDRDGNLWWLVAFSADGVIAANTNVVRVLAGANAAAIGTFYFAGANAWDATYPCSWITAAAAVRNTDELTTAINFDAFTAENDDFTVYARLARPSHFDAVGVIHANPGIVRLGTTAPAFGINFGASARGTVAHIDTLGTDVSMTAGIPSGAIPEVCAQFADLAVGGKTRLDIGPGFGAFSTLATPISALGNSTMRIGDYDFELDGVLFDLKVARGLFTLQQMREAY